MREFPFQDELSLDPNHTPEGRQVSNCYIYFAAEATEAQKSWWQVSVRARTRPILTALPSAHLGFPRGTFVSVEMVALLTVNFRLPALSLAGLSQSLLPHLSPSVPECRAPGKPGCPQTPEVSPGDRAFHSTITESWKLTSEQGREALTGGGGVGVGGVVEQNLGYGNPCS
jgi:hypothetical protein